MNKGLRRKSGSCTGTTPHPEGITDLMNKGLRPSISTFTIQKAVLEGITDLMNKGLRPGARCGEAIAEFGKESPT